MKAKKDALVWHGSGSPVGKAARASRPRSSQPNTQGASPSPAGSIRRLRLN